MKRSFKNLLNKIGISQRCEGKVDEDGTVTVTKILSYDIVSSPGFSNASFSNINDLHDKIQREIQRKILLKERKEKINKLNNI